MIESFEAYGSVYYKSIYKGSEYHLRLSPSYEGLWECHSSRLSLGPRNVGSTKYFKSLEEAENQMKAFKGLSILLEIN
jgi:hypothetical protein